ncbi:MAG: hypothetical protein ACREP9_15665 [Candidatus Dormibacteraceae bacterium]
MPDDPAEFGEWFLCSLCFKAVVQDGDAWECPHCGSTAFVSLTPEENVTINSIIL